MRRKEKVEERTEINMAAERHRVERTTRTPETRAERERLFKLENADAFALMNAWVDEHGLPLDRYRQF